MKLSDILHHKFNTAIIIDFTKVLLGGTSYLLKYGITGNI